MHSLSLPRGLCTVAKWWVPGPSKGISWCRATWHLLGLPDVLERVEEFRGFVVALLASCAKRRQLRRPNRSFSKIRFGAYANSGGWRFASALCFMQSTPV